MATSEKIFDQLLIMKYQSGDSKSLSLLVKRWQPKLVERIFFLTKNHDASHDIAQESWSAIVKNIRKLKDPARFSAWAYTIANRKSYDWIKSVQKDRSVFDIQSEVESQNAESAQETEDYPVNVIRSMIKSFPQKEQLILNLFYLENYSLKEISKLTKLPVGTVKSKLFYTREKLKSIIKKGVEHA